MKILILEPYFTGSHKNWAEGYQKHSKHEIKILSMKGQFWKWRMHGGAVTLAREFKYQNLKPDLILASDMLDLSTFISLTKTKAKSVMYFHENQLSYPWSPTDRDKKMKRDHHYSFINYISALCADKTLFNSKFHLDIFFKKLHTFLNHFPDYNELDSIQTIRNKSEVLNLAIDLRQFDDYKTVHYSKPLILWNHRWEYDKNPEMFFRCLKYIKDKGYNFSLVVLGENFSNTPKIFEKAKVTFKENILHWGYVEDLKSYAKWLWKANILPVTSNQDFFGVSVMEAIYCEAFPLLPYRLSFPELIPKEFHCDYFYQNDNDLNEKLISLIKTYKNRDSKALKKVALKFDWNYLAPVYDTKMISLIK